MPVLLPENKNTHRINAVLNFAHSNFHTNLKLESLADAACLSKYHFLRLFNDQVGESPISFLKRIRLERSACLLSYAHKWPILDVALNCGFSSSQLFSRSFTDKFGHCPREYRSVYKFNLREKSLRQLFQAKGITYDQIGIVKVAPTRVAYVRNIGSYFGSGGNAGTRMAVESIIKWAKSHGLWAESERIIEVSWDCSSMTPDTLCRYDACIPIPDNYTNTSDISVQTLPGGFYAFMKTTIEKGKEVLLNWKLFDLELSTSPKFKRYKFESNIGPWYEICSPKYFDQRRKIVLCTHLQPCSSLLDYPLYRGQMCSPIDAS